MKQQILPRLDAALAALALLTLVASGCGGPTPTPSPTPVPATPVPVATMAPTKAPPSPTSAATPAPVLTPAGQTAQFTDAFSYCAAVGTLDSPDARYTGPKTPDPVLEGLRKALNIPATTPNDQFERSTFWRCIGGKVYACNVGANIPCTTKAVTDKTPTQAMNDYCKANPTSDFVPAFVTGRATVYSWQCTNGTPTIAKELTKPDAAGFLSMFWYEITGK
ncbi:MAG: hypothetical protein Q8O07_02395 [Chloroflexota bacterium]|nr:hypothetical protein [Chloroflexota bacterium]